jgi:hypothetical protein
MVASTSREMVASLRGHYTTSRGMFAIGLLEDVTRQYTEHMTAVVCACVSGLRSGHLLYVKVPSKQTESLSVVNHRTY